MAGSIALVQEALAQRPTRAARMDPNAPELVRRKRERLPGLGLRVSPTLGRSGIVFILEMANAPSIFSTEGEILPRSREIITYNT